MFVAGPQLATLYLVAVVTLVRARRVVRRRVLRCIVGSVWVGVSGWDGGWGREAYGWLFVGFLV